MPDLFQKKGFPSFYEAVLRFPIIRQIRTQEYRTLCRIFDAELQPGDSVLEVGAGTGYYTFEIAQRVKNMVAVERAPSMARVLKQRIAKTGAKNITVVESDIFNYKPLKSFDAVVAIGVLDGISEWREFLDHCIALASRRVIGTLPRPSIWATLYSFFGKITGQYTRSYPPEEVTNYLNGRSFELHETGLKTRWTNGLTIIAVVRTTM